jgi:hypothetical protein
MFTRRWSDGRRRGYRDVSNFGRNLALWVIVALLLVALFNLFQPSGTSSRAQDAGRLQRLRQ